MDKMEDKLFDAILDKDNDTVTECISNGMTALSKSSSSDMALHFACLNSNFEALKLLKETLQEGDIDTINVEEDTICGTALHMSMDGQVDSEVVRLLLEWGANPNAKDAKGSTVLHELIYRAWEDLEDDFESEESMWEDIEDNSLSDGTSSNEQENTTTHTDRELEHYKGDSYFRKLSMLVQFGANMNLPHSHTSMPPVHFWCQNFIWYTESNIEKEIPYWCHQFLKALLEYGADPNVLNERGETALQILTPRHYKPQHTLFMNSYKELLSLVIPKQSDVNQKNIYGRTLLQCAVEHSNEVFVKLLLELHAEIDHQDKFGLSAIHLIIHNITYDETELVRGILRALISKEANVNIRDKHGLTPLHHAVHLNNHTALTELLRAGALTDVRDNDERTVLDVAKVLRNETSFELINFRYAATKKAAEPHSSVPVDVPESVDVNKSLPNVLSKNKVPIQNTSPTSDISRGWYFPLCCYKQYSTVNAWSDQTENVPEPSVDEWLKTYPMCEHNRKVVLQNSISALQTNTKQVLLDRVDEHSMRNEISELALRVSDVVAAFNPIFESNVIFGGSVSEGTKVGACDEFDLVFDLWKLRQLTDIVESDAEQKKGFVRLKVRNKDEFVKHDLSHLVDKDGFLNRLQASNAFHKYFERALRTEDVWHGTSYFSFWGTTDSAGECSNIGQLHLVWYGPWCVRQDVSVDIAPMIRICGWQSVNCNSNIRIVEQKVVEAIGCYLMMKDTSRYINQEEDQEDDEEDTKATAEMKIGEQSMESLFKISISQVEHATMHYLPPEAKMGYKIAKSIQLQCPIVLFSLSDISMDSLDCRIIKIKSESGDDEARGIIHVSEYLTSYVLKTGLFHELHHQDIRVAFQESELHHENWNKMITQESACRPGSLTKAEVTSSLEWALRIYKRLLFLIQHEEKIPEYFLPTMEATKVRGQTRSFVKIASTFLKILIYLLEHFEVPEDIKE